MARLEGRQEGGKARDRLSRGGLELPHPRVPRLWVVHREGLVGPPGRIDPRHGIRALRERLVVLEGVGGIVGGADDRHLELLEEAQGREGILLQEGARALEDLPGRPRGEQGLDPEGPLQLHVRPVVERVPQGLGHGGGPGLELLEVRGVSGDEPLGHPVRAHGPPLVVVAVQPGLGERAEAVVARHLLGRQVAVVVHDGQVAGVAVEELGRDVALEQEVVVHEAGFGHDLSVLRGMGAGPVTRERPGPRCLRNGRGRRPPPGCDDPRVRRTGAAGSRGSRQGEILEGGAMASHVGHRRRMGGGVGARLLAHELEPGGAEVGRGDAVLLNGHRPLGAGELDLSRVARPGGGRGLEGGEGTASKLEGGHEGVFAFDGVLQVGRAGEHAVDVPHQPEKQVHGVDALIDDGAPAVESAGAAPARARVVLGRPPPLHPRRGQEEAPQGPVVDGLPQAHEARREAVLEEEAELHPGRVASLDERIGALHGHVDGLLREHVQALAGRRDALRGVKAGGASDQHQIEGAVPQERLRVGVGDGPMTRGQRPGPLRVLPGDRGDPQALDLAGRPGVGVADVAATQDADVEHSRHRLLEGEGHAALRSLHRLAALDHDAELVGTRG